MSIGCTDCYRMNVCDVCINAELQIEHHRRHSVSEPEEKKINISSGEDAFIGEPVDYSLD